MKIIVPNYYKKFSCIAGECKHSCCVGWEIDIDDDTFEYYKSVGGEFGKRLIRNITTEKNIHHFTLSDNDRCPFLNKDNLCDIILNIGEDKLCQICADHPRYRNFFSDRVEIGLGLCCEAASALILTQKEKTKLVTLSDDGKDNPRDEFDEQFFTLRDYLFGIIQDRTKSINERISQLLTELDITFPKKTPPQWTDIYLGLEILDKAWISEINGLKHLTDIPHNLFIFPEWETAFEQLLIYFLYRHMADGINDGTIKPRITFSIHGLYIICLLCASRAVKNGSILIDDFTDLARMYSSEIEYCEENIDNILNIMTSDSETEQL